MNENEKLIFKIVEKTREYLDKHGLENTEIDTIKKELKISDEEFHSLIKSKEHLIEIVLKEERRSFSSIFEEYDFDGMNAIDIILIVAMEMHKRFYFINPGITYEIRHAYPELYNQHIQEKLQFIYSKLQINIEKGTSQGIYRNDISKELIARHWLSRIVDLHNPKEFPNEEISFPVLFEQSIESFIMSVANEEGIKYYKQRKQLMSFLNFNR